MDGFTVQAFREGGHQGGARGAGHTSASHHDRNRGRHRGHGHGQHQSHDDYGGIIFSSNHLLSLVVFE